MSCFKAVATLIILLCDVSISSKGRLDDHEDHTGSYSDLFNSIDKNHNGNVSPEEIEEFIVQNGGISLDNELEIASAVERVMGSLDGNHDDKVKVEDLSRFWISQASMLTVDDVCDWVVHSLHMPDSVTEIIRDNAVTGYDFPDLVENDGQRIESELGITKRTLKSRLYRGIVMRLVGMGTLPLELLSVAADRVSCSEIRLDWTVYKKEKNSFPTHKYLVERNEPSNYFDSGYKPNDSATIDELLVVRPVRIDGSIEADLPPDFSLIPAVRQEWVAVCSDMATFCIDTGLMPGTIYKYRISAWNAIGRNEYTHIQVSTKSNCSVLYDLLNEAEVAIIKPGIEFSVLFAAFHAYVRWFAFWTAYLLFGTVVACFLLETVYRLMMSCSLLQKTQFGEELGSVDGFRPTKFIRLFGIEVPLSEKAASVIAKMRVWMVENIFEVALLFLPKSLQRTLDAIAIATRKDPRNPTGELKTPIKLSLNRVRQRAVAGSQFDFSSDVSVSSATTTQCSTSGLPLNLKRCYICKKKFSYMLRPKHYCGKCNQIFCRRCASHIDHVWPTPCKFNSRCLCKECSV